MAMFTELVANELFRARAEHWPLNSAHEAYAVILEELDEFWGELKLKPQDPGNMLCELVQIGAMAQRAAEDLRLLEENET